MTALITSIAELRERRAALPGTVAVVMTMGALHDGHRALIEHARQSADHVIVTDFVNPLQFGPGEDFERYPRDLDADLRVVEGRAELLFAPSVEEMYPTLPPAVSVSAGTLGRIHEGARRPGHFDGVVTVVTKLLQITQPHIAVFGRKDAQQLAIIERLVADLNIPVRIEAVPIQREESGLARSSRNAYLSAEGRTRALALSRAVQAIEAAAPSASAVREAARRAQQDDAVEWDYLLLLNPADLQEIGADARGDVLVMMAARVEGTRLLDATVVQVTGD